MSTAARPPPFHRSGSSSLTNTSMLGGTMGSFNANASNASVTSTPTATPPPPSVFVEASLPAQSSVIYTAVYSGVHVYEMTINNIAVMRRQADDWLNATQILKVAGIEKGKRTKVLEKEILPGDHEKVQGGYGKYQGTWINFERGRQFCQQYGVEELLRNLLEFDPRRLGPEATPTKEQAMAAKRKRMYNTGMNQSNGSQGPFFSNISSTATNALAAISKAAQYENNSRPTPSRATPTSSMNQMSSQESFVAPPTFISEPSFAPTIPDSAYASQAGVPLKLYADVAESPRKRLRMTPDEESFTQPFPDLDLTPRALAPLDREILDNADRAIEILTSLFISPPASNYDNHIGLQTLSEEDIDLPIDKMGHTAMHWAAALANVPLIRLLVAKGASVLRVNYAGETPLIRGCLVTNNLENASFPELLELLHPGITVVDDSGRTVLHHISLMSGIKGRSAASRYYLESLLEFVVRQGAPGNAVNGVRRTKAINLGRFMSEIVNAQDKSGDTALNIAARIGNKSIVSQLLEVGADPSIPNRAGLRPLDFGIGGDPIPMSRSKDQPWVVPQNVLQKSEDILSSMTEMIAGLDRDFQMEIKAKQTEIDATHGQLRESTLTLNEERRKTEQLKQRSTEKNELGQKHQNLLRAVQEENLKFQQKYSHIAPINNSNNDNKHNIKTINYDSDSPYKINPEMVNGDFKNLTAAQSQYLKTLPSSAVLKARVAAYKQNEDALDALAATLRGRSLDLEANFRKVVALCTGVEVERVDMLLEGLLQAIESDPGDVETVRLTSFLRKVDESQVKL